jgi:phosphoribosylformylglycinamidine cyclo-ligase
LAETLLAVHRSYLHPVQEVLRQVEVRGISHVTGGGILGNTRRILPQGLDLALDRQAWQWPEIFRLIQRCGEVPDGEMERAFNLGIGMVLILAPGDVDRAVRLLVEMGEAPLLIGSVVKA